jgi:hypothetical protein
MELTQILIGLTALGLFAGLISLNLVQQTVGIKFAVQLLKAKRLKKKGYGLLKVFNIGGRPEYKTVKFAPLIRYTIKENDEDRNKLVLFNQFAKYEDFGADIPILECNPNHIAPKNYLNGASITVSPEVTEKLIVDGAKSQEEIDLLKKHRRNALIFVGILLVGIIVGFDLYSQRIADANAQIAQLAQTCAQGTIITGQG